jgi:hypothetical protein
MAFRERIEAILKAKDSARFKAAMDLASKAVEHFEKQEEHATAQSAVLDEILNALEEQTHELTFAMAALSHEVNGLGHDMLELAADATVANTVMKKSGSNAVFLGKSWAFWKDRLSLTRSELYTTALTIGTYLSPALIALGSSFAYAAVGGGAVAGAGMASFVAGLLGIISIATPVFNGIKKIKTAQDQLNTTIDQYGAASIQASRANAHLYAVIQNNGGPAVASLLGRVEDLRDAWASLTAPGRANFIDILDQGLKGAQKLAPLAASQANQVVGALRAAVLSVMPDITGKEGQSTLRALGDIFRSSIGPGIRGAVNILVIFGRGIKAAAPWLKRVASGWERLTKSWRDRATQNRVSKFLNEAVNHFRAWWGLAKALGTTLMLVLKGSRKQGESLVVQMTVLVNKFNDWLRMMEDTGKVDAFFRSYINSLKQVVWALQNPMDALDRYMPAVVAGINTYLPKIMDAIANTLATHGPAAAGIFLQAFVNAGAWAKFLTVAFFLTKFGFFGALGKKVAGIFIVPFVTRFTEAFAASIAIESAAGGRIGLAMSSAGSMAGKFFGKALILGIIVGIIAAAPEIGKQLGKIPIIGGFLGRYSGGAQGSGDKAWGNLWGDIKDTFNPSKWWERMNPGYRGKAAGGIIFPGQTRWVGERGPEIAHATTAGTMVTPGSRTPTLPKPIVDIPDLTGAIRLISNVSVQVDRREIARAVSDQRAYDAARRGQED